MCWHQTPGRAVLPSMRPRQLCRLLHHVPTMAAKLCLCSLTACLLPCPCLSVFVPAALTFIFLFAFSFVFTWLSFIRRSSSTCGKHCSAFRHLVTFLTAPVAVPCEGFAFAFIAVNGANSSSSVSHDALAIILNAGAVPLPQMFHQQHIISAHIKRCAPH